LYFKNKMISAICFTSLYDYRFENWPTEFVAVPRIGDRVCAESGEVLRVVAIEHSMRKNIETGKSEPYIRVEPQ